MKRMLRAATAGLVLALGLVVMPNAIAAATADPIGNCTTTVGTIVAVDFAHWGGPIVRGCGVNDPNGYALLHAAGFGTTGDQHDGPAFICRIGNQAFQRGTQYPTAAARRLRPHAARDRVLVVLARARRAEHVDATARSARRATHRSRARSNCGRSAAPTSAAPPVPACRASVPTHSAPTTRRPPDRVRFRRRRPRRVRPSRARARAPAPDRRPRTRRRRSSPDRRPRRHPVRGRATAPQPGAKSDAHHAAAVPPVRQRRRPRPELRRSRREHRASSPHCRPSRSMVRRDRSRRC